MNNALRVVPNDGATKSYRNAVVEKDTQNRQLLGCGKLNGRNRRAARQFQHSHGMFLRHIREISQKLIQRITRFQIVEQILNRHARAGEYRRTREAVLGGGDERVRKRHGSRAFGKSRKDNSISKKRFAGHSRRSDHFRIHN